VSNIKTKCLTWQIDMFQDKRLPGNLKAPIPHLLKSTLKEMSSKDKNITGISIYIKLDYWYVSHSKNCQYRIALAYFYKAIGENYNI